MEYMTVLKRPGEADVRKMEEGGLRCELRRTSMKSRLADRRLCSQALFIGVMLILMLVMFTSQLIVHVQMQDLKGQLDVTKQKVNDMLDAALIDKHIQDEIDRSQSIKKKDGRFGNGKRHDPLPPVYFGLRGGGRISGLGVFQWDVSNSNSFLTPNVHPTFSSPGKLEKVQITQAGMYSITVQINVNGRSDPGSIFSPVGYWICKDEPDHNGIRFETLLDKVFLTQDDRGHIRTVRGGTIDDPPVDSITYSGSLYLKANDRIYVKRPNETRNDNSIIFDNSAASAHFTGVLTVRE